MSTVAEIEAAVALLPRDQQTELLRGLSAKFGRKLFKEANPFGRGTTGDRSNLSEEMDDSGEEA